MTLKERLKKQLDTATPTLNRPHYQAGKLEKIAEEFAIGFAEWCIESEGKDYNKYKYRNRKELLEIYKKEKGL
jgi:hypothetical protein